MKEHNTNTNKKKIVASKTRFEEKFKSFIEIVDERINRLKEKGIDVSEEGRGKYDGQIEKLKEQRKELARKLESISEANEEKWIEINENINDDYECLKDEAEVTYQSNMSEFKHMKIHSNGF